MNTWKPIMFVNAPNRPRCVVWRNAEGEYCATAQAVGNGLGKPAADVGGVRLDRAIDDCVTGFACTTPVEQWIPAESPADVWTLTLTLHRVRRCQGNRPHGVPGNGRAPRQDRGVPGGE